VDLPGDPRLGLSRGLGGLGGGGLKERLTKGAVGAVVSFPTVVVPPGEPSLGNHVGGQLSGGTSIKDIYGEAFRPSDRFVLAPKRLVPQPVVEKLKGWLLRPEAYYVKGGVGYLGEVPGEGAIGAEGQSSSPGGESGTISSTGVVVGPVRGEEGRELVFPLLSPRIVEGGGGPHAFGFTVGGVRGRGQIYPDGTLSSSGYEGFIPSTKGTVASVVRDRGRFVELAVLRGDLARKVTNFASGQPNMDPKEQAVTLEAGPTQQNVPSSDASEGVSENFTTP